MLLENQFQYCKSQDLDEVILLNAQIGWDFSYNKHAHEEFSLGVTLSGRQDFFANGMFHRSQPGNIIVFNPGEVHDGHSGGDDPLRYRMVYIHPKSLRAALAAAGMQNAHDFRFTDTVFQDDALRIDLLCLANLIEGRHTESLAQESRLYALAERIAQLHHDYVPPPDAKKADRLLLRARDYIQSHLQEELSLEQISQQAALSKFHFLRLFRQQFGITPHQYVLNCRINGARDALLAGVPLNNVVHDFCFTDLSHLNRRFKAVFGITPHQYQQAVLSHQEW